MRQDPEKAGADAAEQAVAAPESTELAEANGYQGRTNIPGLTWRDRIDALYKSSAQVQSPFGW